ncbi:MAG TPA: carbamoyltransferase C-terminal domain-containing protein [bacterium]|nr:carbamoyltransferase C-terminal domain-containing protein [bacterium]HQG46503.1 carbamoyltransferase C-terminal domain-containing protein [bacterium]HQI49315.1 carbamoyltransferase C-terminal domain-containing protein [bacterium]HQJ64274.1 carbamoyltransferase C-terminal domain-containing protein [bacterium]
MRILGYYDDHNAGSAIIEDGKILAAVEEERLSRIKLHNGNEDGEPILSLEMVLKMTNSKPENIDKIAIGIMPAAEMQAYIHHDLFKVQKNRKWILASLLSKSITWDQYWLWYPYFYNQFRINRAKKLLAKVGLGDKPIEFVDHHRSHAAAAYFSSGRSRALIVTLDGQGDGQCGQVWLGEEGRLTHLKSVSSYHSPGLFYNFITWYLGYKPMRHEGKITGLAAHGQYEHVAEHFEKMFGLENGEFRYYMAEAQYQHAYPHRTNYNKFRDALPKAFEAFTPADVAAGVQVLTERAVAGYVDQFLQKTGPIDVVMAGGVFANVRVNQAVAELPNARSVFIFPAMGDNGIPAGAALYTFYKSMGWPEIHTMPRLDDVYLGPSYTDAEIEAELKKAGLQYTWHDNIAPVIAELLTRSAVVARFDGRMEYGPRALGNRTILYQSTDKTVNDWLNHKLKRTEFMPFAPVTLAEDMEENYEHIAKNEYPARFMTITFNCSKSMQQRCPAVVHVDNTARPQLIDEKTNKVYYHIVKEYKKLTGLSSVINTSFNMHEEPIVCTPGDAIRAFTQGYLEYLAISNFLVTSPTPEKARSRE